MGSSSSKFKKYLQHGDEYAAMQVYQSSNELRKGLDPNFSYGDSHGHNTPLHYAAKAGFIFEPFFSLFDIHMWQPNLVHGISISY